MMSSARSTWSGMSSRNKAITVVVGALITLWMFGFFSTPPPSLHAMDREMHSAAHPVAPPRDMDARDKWYGKFNHHAIAARNQGQTQEYMLVVDELLRRGSCNLLIFGCGKDSNLWQDLNVGGTTLFIENSLEWIEVVQDHCPQCQILDVKYWTNLAADGGRHNLLGSRELLLYKLLDKSKALGISSWDVILVDAPTGYDKPHTIGRMQSIATAAELSNAESTVFVHDRNREAEQWWSTAYFGVPRAEAAAERQMAMFTGGPRVTAAGRFDSHVVPEGYTAAPSVGTPASTHVSQPPPDLDVRARWAQRFNERARLSGNQGQVQEYMLVVDELLRRGPANLLIFGCGKDSTLWQELNAGGRTVFLEHFPSWIDTVKESCPDCNIQTVEYWTNMKRDQDRLFLVGSKQLVIQSVVGLTRSAGLSSWDVILVDAPQGYEGNDANPGRMQSIATAAQVADRHTSVFVHDANRHLEDLWSVAYFGAFAEEAIAQRKMRHFADGPWIQAPAAA